MSSIARWTYTSTATVEPFLGFDEFGGRSYGSQYEIKCTFIVEVAQSKDDAGEPFTSKHAVFTEDARPVYLDRITLPGFEPCEVRSRTAWDMSFFNDSMDFKLLLG